MTIKKIILGVTENNYSVICYQLAPRVELLACQIYDKKEFTVKALKQFLAEQDLHQVEASIILGSQLYRILMMDRPNIKDEELAQAAKWLAKDLIKENVDNVVLDAFPAVERASKVNKLYIVIANKQYLQDLYDMCFVAGVNLKEITIAEFGFLLLAPSENQVSLVVYALGGGGVRVLIIYNNEIDFIRNIKIKSAIEQENNTRCEEVALELNRSMDFYATQFGESVKEILCVPSQFFSGNFVEMLKQTLTVNVGLLYKNDFSEFLDDSRWDEHIMAFGLITEENVEYKNVAKN